MKRFLILIMVFITVFAVSCSKKKEKPVFEEEVTKEISAEEGGKIESSDGNTSIEIPGDALDSDTKITMRIYSASDFPSEEGEKIVSKVVEFEPSGTIFKKPVIISMNATESFENKILTAAVFKEAENKWSYSEKGTYILLNREAGGDPIMTSAAGDPIMLNAAGDPIMMSAGGDPIMLSSAGDPIMLASAGDPIMTNAAGDPIMNAAAGDPIMMTTGHFTAFTFIVLKSESQIETPGEEPEKDDEIKDNDIVDEPIIKDDDDDNDIDIPDEEEDADVSDEDETTDEDEIPDEIKDEDETPDESEDDDIIIPEPEKVYSKVLCTGLSVCTDNKNQILCPKEGKDFYGQDAQYAARKGCVPHSYTAIPKPEGDETGYYRVKDNVTGLTWLITGEYVAYAEKDTACAGISYGDTEWRIPTPKEFLSIVDSEYAIDPLYFNSLWNFHEEGHPYVWTDTAYMYYDYADGMISTVAEDEKVYLDQLYGDLICVSGEKYGEVHSEDYETLSVGSDYMVHDKSTGLFWQKASVSGKTWIKALEYCENLDYAGYTDWRLPNKNELITLLDYSKTGEILSSFPDIQLEVLWSSTSHIDTAWFVITDGNIDMWYSNLPQWEPCDYEGCEYEVDYGINTRCVRSDLEEKEEIQECDGTGVGPCRDANGVIWSSRLYPRIFIGNTDGVIAEMCRYLNENGSSQWRLPTINEIRKIVTSNKLKTGGSCGITDSNFDDSYFDEEACSGDKPSKTILNDYGTMVSGTFQEGGNNYYYSLYLWAVNTADGELEKGDVYYDSSVVQRCVLDTSLNYEKTPYLDENGLLWSDISPYWDHVNSAQEYCPALSLTDHEHWWRMPTLSELETLLRNVCEHEEYESCQYDLNGRYSVFGDISPLISSDYINDGSYYYINFSNGKTDHDKDGFGRIRCVSDSPSPCVDNTCASVENSTGTCIPLSESEYACGCMEHYKWQNSACVAETNEVNCTGKPENSEWNQTPKILQEWNGSGWTPSEVGTYSETSVDNECHFVCKEHYTWQEPDCVADEIDSHCTELAVNAEWWNENIRQTWSGDSEGWQPTTKGSYSETAVDNECRYKCKDGYEWNNFECVRSVALPLGNICTGQLKCYTEDSVADCSELPKQLSGQDAQYNDKCTPHSMALHTVGEDKIVVDRNTKLIWQQSFSSLSSKENALEYCASLNYAGISSGWRLPNPDELMTISNQIGDGGVDTAYFTLQSSNTWIWTSKEQTGTHAGNFLFHSAGGSLFPYSYSAAPICVFGEELPTGVFVETTETGGDEAYSIVTDSTTGLIWQGTYSEEQKTWQEALYYCDNLVYAGRDDWRLPNANELVSIAKFGKEEPPYSDFPEMPAESFWSSSTWSPTYSWSVDFGWLGYAGYVKSERRYARCVAGPVAE